MHGYASWTAVGRARAFALTALAASGTGGLGRTARPRGPTACDRRRHLWPTRAGAVHQREAYRDRRWRWPGLPRRGAWCGTGRDLTAPTLVSGVARLHVSVTVAGTTSLFAYLYDVDASGTGRLMTHGTVTVAGSGAPTSASSRSRGPCRRGTASVLVVDTVDPALPRASVPGTAVDRRSSRRSGDAVGAAGLTAQPDSRCRRRAAARRRPACPRRGGTARR